MRCWMISISIIIVLFFLYSCDNKEERKKTVVEVVSIWLDSEYYSERVYALKYICDNKIKSGKLAKKMYDIINSQASTDLEKCWAHAVLYQMDINKKRHMESLVRYYKKHPENIHFGEQFKNFIEDAMPVLKKNLSNDKLKEKTLLIIAIGEKDIDNISATIKTLLLEEDDKMNKLCARWALARIGENPHENIRHMNKMFMESEELNFKSRYLTLAVVTHRDDREIAKYFLPAMCKELRENDDNTIKSHIITGISFFHSYEESKKCLKEVYYSENNKKLKEEIKIAVPELNPHVPTP